MKDITTDSADAGEIKPEGFQMMLRHSARASCCSYIDVGARNYCVRFESHLALLS